MSKLELIAELEQLRAICRETRDTLEVIDQWLSSASTRQAAMDSMWRLQRMLQQAGFEYRWKNILDWRGSLVKELNDAGFYNSPDGMRYDPTAADKKPYRVYGNATGPTLKEVVAGYEAYQERDWAGD